MTFFCEKQKSQCCFGPHWLSLYEQTILQNINFFVVFSNLSTSLVSFALYPCNDTRKAHGMEVTKLSVNHCLQETNKKCVSNTASNVQPLQKLNKYQLFLLRNLCKLGF